MEVVSSRSYKVVVVTIDPSARASLANYFGTSTMEAHLKMATYLKAMVRILYYILSDGYTVLSLFLQLCFVPMLPIVCFCSITLLLHAPPLPSLPFPLTDVVRGCLVIIIFSPIYI